MSLIDLRNEFTPAIVAANWTEAASNAVPYLGAGLFPAKKKAGLDLSWVKGHKNVPVSLMPTAFDARMTFRDREGLTIMKTEMPFFREAYKIKEKDRQELMRIMDANDPYIREILARIFDDANDLINGANVVPERMIMQLLFPENGNVGISFKANGMNYTYNYDVDGAWKTSNYTALTGTGLWSAADTADPFADFQAAKDKVQNSTGAVPVIAIMNSVTFNAMSKTAAVKNRYLTTNGMSLGYLTDNEVLSSVQSTSGLQVIRYDKAYRDEDKQVKKFVPDGYVALIPAGTLGSTFYGTTPEEADLMGDAKAEVSIVNTGVAITREVTTHPVNINIWASEIVLPSYERMDDVAVLKVL